MSSSPAAEEQRVVIELEAVLAEERRRASRRHFWDMFPDDGPYRRALYPKHLELFEVGATYRERGFMAANRVGKTQAGAYEATCHLTGLYPHWWAGRRFKGPGEWWAAGKTNETTRDIIQAALLGHLMGSNASKQISGTGMVPGDFLGDVTWRQGFSDLVDTIKVKHFSVPGVQDGWSILGLKSYQQGRGSFEGTAKHGIWLDEEPPSDIYEECLIRTATTGGIILTTFTPLDGLTEVALSFLPADQRPGP